MRKFKIGTSFFGNINKPKSKKTKFIPEDIIYKNLLDDVSTDDILVNINFEIEKILKTVDSSVQIYKKKLKRTNDKKLF